MSEGWRVERKVEDEWRWWIVERIGGRWRFLFIHCSANQLGWGQTRSRTSFLQYSRILPNKYFFLSQDRPIGGTTGAALPQQKWSGWWIAGVVALGGKAFAECAISLYYSPDSNSPSSRLPDSNSLGHTQTHSSTACAYQCTCKRIAFKQSTYSQKNTSFFGNSTVHSSESHWKKKVNLYLVQSGHSNKAKPNVDDVKYAAFPMFLLVRSTESAWSFTKYKSGRQHW